MAKPHAPQGYNTINPFIITTNAPKMIKFLEQVFNAKEVEEAHTLDDDGLLLHSEFKIGDSTVMVADRKKDWPPTPSLLQVYVSDIDSVLAKAEALDGTVVTKPTDFYGDTLSRVKDPCGNLWWIYQHSDQEVDWGGEAHEGDWSAEPSQELTYIHASLLDAMKNLEK